jgi:hypothetical protein
MSQIQYRNEKVETKRVYFAGTDVLPQGAALCYDATAGNATAADNERAFRVKKPTTANFQNFAGILTDNFAGVQGPAMVEIFVPVARGQKVTVRSSANNVIDVTELRLKDQSYALDTAGTGPVIARAMQTVDRSGTSGPVQALLLGPVAPAASAALAALTMGTNITAATADGSLEDSASTTPTEANFNNNMKEIGVRLNAITAALVKAGIIKP